MAKVKNEFDASKCGTRLGRDQHRHRGEIPCEPCRVAWNEISRARQRKARASGWKRTPNHNLICEQCGTEFATRLRSQRFCSQRCHGESKRQTYSQELVYVGPRLTRPAPQTPVTITAGPKFWSVLTEGPCAWCSERFVGFNEAAKYCSARCGKQATKYRHGRFLIAPRKRLAIYERDNWTCQICDEPVDRDADYRDPWAPTLDHITPQSHTLIPDHSPENLRTAHRWCNSIRGDLSYYTDADLRSA